MSEVIKKIKLPNNTEYDIHEPATTSIYGITKLYDNINSSSASLAATANAAYLASRNVYQSNTTTNSWRKVLLQGNLDNSSTATVTNVTQQVFANQYISAHPSTGTLRANIYNIADHVEIQWNSNDQSIDFIFI